MAEMTENGVEERSSKRRRLDHPQNVHVYPLETADQLHNLLWFRQSVAPDVKAAVNQFKDFLVAITKNDDLAAQSRYLRVLRQYCNAQTASSKDELDFPDLIATWSFATQSNNDPICSAIPAALAQFYKTISGVLEFREFGLSLGHTLLKRDQIRLFDRGLSASKSKEHLISPCLRLLTEIISFDGGSLAPKVFDRRDVLFRRLDFLLDQQSVEEGGDRRKPSVRRMALRLLIAGLKFLDTGSKAEFIAHGRILRNCLRGLLSDGDDIVVDVLKSIEVGVIEDKDLPRIAKSRILQQECLTSLAALYEYEVDPNHPDSTTKVRDVTHNTLAKICTTRKGILLPQAGWYPVAFDTRIEALSDGSHVNLGLDSPLHVEEYKSNIPLKNGGLSAFATTLNPEHDVLQSTLLLQMFRSAPELVADYFSKKSKLSASSSDDPVWRSQFAFLFSIVQLPVPKNFGWQNGTPPSPPPTSITVESIIPRPFDRATLSKYLTSNEDVLVLSVARLLTVSLTKLQNVLNSFEKMKNSSEWAQASTRLVQAILQRVPKLQEVVNALQRAEKDNDPVRTAIFECLAIYHQVLPEATAGSRFDISPTLIDVLSLSLSSERSREAKQDLGEQVLHLVTMAELSSVTRWWNKPDSETISLFTQVLRFAVSLPSGEVTTKLLTISRSVASSAGFLHSDALSFAALRLSVASTKKFEASFEVWSMLDNAIHRAVQSPVRYLDRLELIQEDVSDRKGLSLLAAAVAEQWQFVLKKYNGQKDVLKNISEWIVRFCSALDSAGENFRVMEQFQQDMLQQAEGKSKVIFQKAIEKGHKKAIILESEEKDSTPGLEQSASQSAAASSKLRDLLGTPTATIDSLDGIERWDERTDIELSIQSGKMAKLLQSTSSQEEEVRRQAFNLLQGLVHIVQQSTYDEKVQVHLLVGELVQTIRQNTLEIPLPSFAGELAAGLLQIVADPTNKMFGKANKFLLRSPVWDLKRLISYWVRDILFQEPESENPGAWSDEHEWLLHLLIDGLKTSTDMGMYRRSGVFEKILVAYSKPALAWSIRRLILTLIWRAVYVGGADTLITRTGVKEWLHMVRTLDKENHDVIQQITQAIDEACNEKLIEAWRKDLPVLRNPVI